MQPLEKQKLALHVSWSTIFINLLLSFFKLFAGIFSASSAMISDSVHSLSDVFSTSVVIIGVRLSVKEPDRGHPYGHERLECVAAVILSAILFATGIGIGCTGISKLLYGRAALAVPGTLALAAAVVSIIVKEGMYHYTRKAAKKTGSSALLADALHHRSDAFSSAGCLLGILGARLGFPFLDPLASVIICVFIAKAAVDIFISSMEKMVDKACDEATIQKIAFTILSQEGVLGLDHLQTRLFGDRIYVDTEIRADGRASLQEAHKIAHRVHDAIETNFSVVKHCMVHVNPVETSSNLNLSK